MAKASQSSFLLRHEFLIRRLHSLTGLVPVGAYMLVHLVTNATVLDGTRVFQSRVDQIHSLGSALPVVEWTFIFLPLIFHAVVGVWIIRSGSPNLSSYHYVSNVRYYLQRVTAWIALFFIFFHVFQMHGWVKSVAHRFHGANFSHLYATSTAADAIQSSLAMELFYLIGVLSCVFHLANGIWTLGITWGFWTTPQAQRRANYVAAAAGLVLAAAGLSALAGMAMVDVQKAFETEEKINAAKVAAGELTAEEVEHHRPQLQTLEPKGAESEAGAEQAAAAASDQRS